MAKVEMPDYPDNSEKAKREIAEVESENKKIISGTVKRKKKSAAKRFGETFFEDDAETVKSYLIFDVLIPAAKDTLSDLVSKGLEMVLYGDTRGSRSRRSKSSSYTNYNKYSSSESRRPQISSRDRRTHNFDDIILDNRGDAEQVLDELIDRIAEYDVATVADLYDAVGVTSQYTDTKYGWYDLDNASIRRCRDGYQLILPRTEHLA